MTLATWFAYHAIQAAILLAFIKFAIDMERVPQPKPGELMPLDRRQVERWKR